MTPEAEVPNKESLQNEQRAEVSSETQWTDQERRKYMIAGRTMTAICTVGSVVLIVDAILRDKQKNLPTALLAAGLGLAGMAVPKSPDIGALVYQQWDKFKEQWNKFKERREGNSPDNP